MKIVKLIRNKSFKRVKLKFSFLNENSLKNTIKLKIQRDVLFSIQNIPKKINFN